MDLNDIPHKISFRKVKYSRLEFVTGELHIVLPFGENPEAVFQRHRRWVKKKYALIEESRNAGPPRGVFPRTEQDFEKLVFTCAAKASKQLGGTVNKIGFRRMRTKWASCNSKGNININTLMKDMPEELIDYVVYHEIAHLRQMRHNDKFWAIIAKKFPHYKELERELSIYWFHLNS
jgi:predicted metal-dependent hydrolase